MCIEYVPGGSLKQLMKNRFDKNLTFTIHEIKTLIISIMIGI